MRESFSIASDVSFALLELVSSIVVMLTFAVFSLSLAIQFCIVGSSGSSSLPSTEKTTFVSLDYVHVKTFLNSEVLSKGN